MVISGDKDQNYKEILKTSEQWKSARANYRFIDVPGMGHTNASPEKIEEALDMGWVLKIYYANPLGVFLCAH